MHDISKSDWKKYRETCLNTRQIHINAIVREILQEK